MKDSDKQSWLYKMQDRKLIIFEEKFDDFFRPDFGADPISGDDDLWPML
jgi:hypothetical protein